jgi:hypothetical protein
MPQDMNRENQSSGSGSSYSGASQDYSGGSRTEGLSSTLRDEAARLKDEAARQGSAAYDSLKEGARSLSAEARDRASRYADAQKEAVSGSLEDFARAIRRASEELSERDQTMASQLVRQAAGGLESMSRSISGASLEDMIDSVRRFGRQHPVAFIGGAVLAGLALGRFARASSRYEYEGDYDASGDWHGEATGEDEFSPSPYRGSSYSAGDTGGFGSSTRAAGDFPSRSQGYAGGGMATDPIQSSSPSSARDPSLAGSSQTGGTAAQPGSISTGE